MNKILVVGPIYIENQIFVDEFPKENEVQIASTHSTFAGSKTINFSKIIQKYGVQADFLGKVGNDDEGGFAIKQLQDNGFDTKNIIISNEDSTGKVTVITNRLGKNEIIIFKGANDKITSDDTKNIKLVDYDLVYAVSSLNVEVLYALIDKTKQSDTPLFLDLASNHKLIELEKLKDVAFITMNKHEASALLNSEITTATDAKAACVKLRETCTGNIIITLDKEGLVLLEKDTNNPVYFSGIKVDNVVDETGAGDILRGVVIAEFLKSRDLKSSIEKAQEVAAKSVQIKGVNNKIMSL